MDPNTGNIYTPDEAATLGLHTDDLIPLDETEAERLLEERRVQTEVIAEKRRVHNAEARRGTEQRNKQHARSRGKAARTARRGNR